MSGSSQGAEGRLTPWPCIKPRNLGRFLFPILWDARWKRLPVAPTDIEKVLYKAPYRVHSKAGIPLWPPECVKLAHAAILHRWQTPFFVRIRQFPEKSVCGLLSPSVGTLLLRHLVHGRKASHANGHWSNIPVFSVLKSIYAKLYSVAYLKVNLAFMPETSQKRNEIPE